MLSGARSKERSSSRKVTPPSPSYMNNDQFAAYLANLRDNRVKRPGGARPQPSDPRRDSGRTSLGARSSLGGSTTRSSIGTLPPSDSSSHNRTQSSDAQIPPGRPSISASLSSRYSTVSGRGRDYYPDRPVPPLKPGAVVPSATYIERGQRWMEKEEAVSLRTAMEDMELKSEPQQEDEERIYQAALDEASELVWQHQHGVKPPEPGAPYRYKQHLRKNSYAHARTASAGFYGNEIEPSGLARDCSSRSVSGSSSSSDGFGSRRSISLGSNPGGDTGPRNSLDQTSEPTMRRPAKPYHGLSNGSYTAQPGRRRSSMKRNISGEVQKPFSGDQIWEEPEGSSPGRFGSPGMMEQVQPLRTKPKNPLNRVQFAAGVPAVVDSPPPPPPKMHKYEIHRNPPTQSRNPLYTTNSRSESPVERDDVPRKHGVEVRGDDIRQATSMRLKDRSPKLPTPTAVSDSPGRPITKPEAVHSAPPGADKTTKPTRSLLSLLRRLVSRRRPRHHVAFPRRLSR